MSDESYTNHLIGESSPYLQQHAHNPVDWYPWGQEAFDLAKTESKPIFLSIGYATCHWCHAMERESFTSPQIAKMMNETFVNVKVDREEYPQVDSLYMEVAQALLGGEGGWPLNLILTPDLKPVFAVTYLPPVGRRGQIGLTELVMQVASLWKGKEREAMLIQGEQLFQAWQEQVKVEISEELPDERYVNEVAELYLRMADPVYGGIQGTPKFPMAFHLDFMLCYGTQHSDSRALFYVEKTLEMMYRGGIYDHLGGGFSRYATDPKWRIPHFEKMLYDNAIIANTYAHAWQVSQNPIFKTVAEEIFHYLLRDMQHQDGGFYSAEDSDSEGSEGRFYTWTYDQIVDALGPTKGKAFADAYGITMEGNFSKGRSVIYRRSDNQLQEMRQRLFEERQKRKRPFRDNKILTAWNGLTIRGLADASCILGHEIYYTAAARAASFIQNHLWHNGRLFRRWFEGEPAKHPCLEDYAFLISGLLSLFNCDGEAHWLMWAIELSNVLTADYKSENGAFYRIDACDPNLLIQQIDLFDGAEPSGNAVHCENLLRLYQMTRAERYLSEAEDILQAAAPFIAHHPLSATYHCLVLQRYLDKRAPTLVIALDDEQSLRQEILKTLRLRFHPHAEIIWRTPALADLIPGISDQKPIDGKTTLYLCREGHCEEPHNDPQKILELIKNI